MGKSSICPGFRFHPTDVELVMYYLKRKLLGKKHKVDAIAEVNIYDFSPWDLPDKSSLRNGDHKWFFLCPTSKKYATGSRTNRATKKGYWKSTGKDRPVEYKQKKVAMIKTLVFHMGQPPKGKRTNWVMHEYRMEAKDLADAGAIQDAYVLCMLFEKSGAGPKNGAQYGAPFEEEEWDDEEVNGSERSALFGLSGATNSLNPNTNGSAITNMTLTEPGPSSINTYSTKTRHEDAQANDVVMLTHEDIASILDDDNNTQEGEDDGIFKDLANISNLDNLCEDAFNMFGIDGAGYTLDTFRAADDLDVNLEKVLKG